MMEPGWPLRHLLESKQPRIRPQTEELNATSTARQWAFDRHVWPLLRLRKRAECYGLVGLQQHPRGARAASGQLRSVSRKRDFVEAIFENWESEFLQMGLNVLLTAVLFQRGSAESKDPEAQHPDDADYSEDMDVDIPWPVRKGGWTLRLYENSLSIALLALFVFSFIMHAVGGASAYNQEQLEHNGTPVSVPEYLATPRFWFESFQNWQSEFLAIGAMIVLSIYLRLYPKTAKLSNIWAQAK
jgi:hypothetical protein